VGELAVTAIGEDRPGIVAAISGALLELEGNIEDSQMSILGGHFAVMLLVRVPDSVSQSEVADRLGAVRDELGLEAVTVSDVGAAGPSSEPPSHVLSVYGADRPGSVHAVSKALAGLGVNVTDLETKLTGADTPVYVMVVEVALAGADPEAVAEALRETGATAGVEVSIRELGTEAL
jgi:glycine cleavage system transcriptional repressor